MSTSGDGLIGQTIAQYHITGRLGQGGMGVVYVADDTTLERKVALKFLPASLHADPEAEKRFVHEAKSASVLDHPNIATIHDVRRTDDGLLFIVMGYYEGRTIRDYIEEDSPLSVDVVVDFCAQIADGLQCAHEAGIIHRDIKPGNVIVTPKGRAVILDFGLAKIQDVTMTTDGTSMGTVAYMSPEQAKNETLDARTDLWSLGVMAYEMLVGRRPFDAGYEAAILYAAAHEEHTPIQLKRSDVPDWLAGVVDRLLEKQRDNRYQSAADALEAFRSAGKDTGAEPDTAEPKTVVASTPLAPTGPYLVDPVTGAFVTTDGHPVAHLSGAAGPFLHSGPWQQPPPTRSRIALWGGGAAAAVLLIAVVGWFVGKTSTGPDKTDISAAERQRARDLHSRAIELRANGRFALAQAEVEEALRMDSTYSEAWATLAAIRINQQNFQAAVEPAQRAVRLDGANAAAWYNLAYALEELGRKREAEATYADAIAADTTFVAGYSALGNLMIGDGRPGEALEVLQKGLSLAPQSELAFLLFKNIGKANLALDNVAGAIGALEESVRRKAEHPESLLLLADAYERSGQNARATDYLERYLEFERDPNQRQRALDRLGR